MDNRKFQDYVDQINRFFVEQGVKIEPFPKLRLLRGNGNRFDPFAPTGNYAGDTQTVTLYIGQRHLKDILRSYCHELIHHNQNLKDPERFASLNKSGALQENSALEKFERDAYSRGNLLFRRWTEETE